MCLERKKSQRKLRHTQKQRQSPPELKRKPSSQSTIFFFLQFYLQQYLIFTLNSISFLPSPSPSALLFWLPDELPEGGAAGKLKVDPCSLLPPNTLEAAGAADDNVASLLPPNTLLLPLPELPASRPDPLARTLPLFNNFEP